MLQASINSIILGFSDSTQASQYAPFATDQKTAFKPILNINPQITATTTNNNLDGISCQSIRTRTSIQIAYANVGNLNNPQAQIQYISYDWSDTTSVYLRVIFCLTIIILNI